MSRKRRRLDYQAKESYDPDNFPIIQQQLINHDSGEPPERVRGRSD